MAGFVTGREDARRFEARRGLIRAAAGSAANLVSSVFRFMMCGVRPSAKIILCARLLMMTVVALPDARPQQPGHSLPKFEDYPVKEVFRRTPHPPVLGTPEQQLYRTRIREGVEEGSGVWINGEWGKEQGKPGPNFAGHYVVIVWGCGAGCIRMAISNAETGAVCDPPVSAGGLALPMLMFPASVGRAPELEYRVNSRLMIIKATPHWERNDAVSYAFYFLWRGEHWTLLRRVPIEE